MEQKVARIISYVFHPLFIPFYMILLLMNTGSYFSLVIPWKGKLLLSAIIFLTTILLPFITGFLLYRIKLVRSFSPESGEERIFMLLNTGIFYYLSYYLLKGTHVSLVFSFFMLGASILVIFAIVITFFRRISMHMIAAGGMAGAFLGLAWNNSREMIIYTFVIILLAGVTGSARLTVKPQKPFGIYAGFLLGMTVMFVLFRMI